jgi:Family of unknown function (DUF6298)/Putative collagen-binding domain of a collagenase
MPPRIVTFAGSSVALQRKKAVYTLIAILTVAVSLTFFPSVLRKASNVGARLYFLSKWNTPSGIIAVRLPATGGPGQKLRKDRVPIASGPLRVDPVNPRYFTTESGEIVYLTGSHTWNNFQDGGGLYPPPRFDYTSYLDFLVSNNHNFFRLYVWEQPRWTVETLDDSYWIDPMPYQRVGPGIANDGRLKFDLSKFNQDYFARMRARIGEAGKRGIYVSIMLFNGWSVRKHIPGNIGQNPWRSHPYNRANNINSIDGDPNGDDSGEEVHELKIPAVTDLQEQYIRKVVDTVNDLDNVLYEISNESAAGSWKWQYEMIKFIKRYEALKPKRHPVGMTVAWPEGDNGKLLASSADWISPNGDAQDRPAATGQKVVIADSDHLSGNRKDPSWVWKSFTRGENPIYMDGYDGSAYGQGGVGARLDDPNAVMVRANLGYTLGYANKLDLRSMAPRADLSSTGYCLASSDVNRPAYLVYLPSGGTAIIDLTKSEGRLSAEWLNPRTGDVIGVLEAEGGGFLSFVAPFQGDAVLFIRGG